ncbi:MAG: RIP metalloprotease RseP [Succinivibrio sp.]
MLSVAGGIFYFLISLGILITVHELGHFLAARMFKVKVEVFSIGFGPVIFAKRGKDGCQYLISAIPLGGYVKMENETAKEKDRRLLPTTSYMAKKVWKRAVIVAAGPFFNIILAVILFTFVNMAGVNERYAVIGHVAENSISQRAGLKPYDKITRINDAEITNWKDVLFELVRYVGTSQKVEFTVSGNAGKDDCRTVELNLDGMVLKRGESPIEKMGLQICIGRATNEISRVLEKSPAKSASLRAGDKVVSINGHETPDWYDVANTIASENTPSLLLIVQRNGEFYNTEVKPETKYNPALRRDSPFIGISPVVEPMDNLVFKNRYPFRQALVKAFNDAKNMSVMILVSTYKLISGSISADNISGPLAIAKGAQESASYGFIVFIGFLATISVNLGILNLLPIPVLDGGHLLFLAYEAVFRHEPNPKMQKLLIGLGIMLLLSVMIVATINDIKGF